MKYCIYLVLVTILFFSCDKPANFEKGSVEVQTNTRSNHQIEDLRLQSDFHSEYRSRFLEEMGYSSSSVSGSSIICTQLCYNEYQNCMWYANSFAEPWRICMQWVIDCRDSDCPEDWCENYTDESVCDEYWQIVIDNMDEIIEETEKCDLEQFKCLEKCDKGPRDEV